jgi:hypothetical protein
MVTWSGATNGRQLLVGVRSVASDQRSPTATTRVPLYPTHLPPPSYLFAPIFPHVVNSSSLAPAHACPTQTSPKNFKYPELLICRSKKYDFFFHEACGKMHLQKKFQKNLKIVWAQVTLTKTGLFAVRTFGLLGVKVWRTLRGNQCLLNSTLLELGGERVGLGDRTIGL